MEPLSETRTDAAIVWFKALSRHRLRSVQRLRVGMTIVKRAIEFIRNDKYGHKIANKCHNKVVMALSESEYRVYLLGSFE